MTKFQNCNILIFFCICILIIGSSTFAQEAPSIWDNILIETFHDENPFQPKFPEEEEIQKDIHKEVKPAKIQEKGKSLWDRIKTIPPEIKKITSDDKKEDKTPIVPPELIITGLIWNTNRPQAIVNGKIVDIGDTIASTRIVAITKTGVDISFKGHTITITP